MKLIYPILCLIAAGCAANKTIVPVVDLDPGHATTQAFIMSSTSEPELVLPPASMTRHLEWTYSIPMPASDTNGNIMFEVDKTESISNPRWFVYCFTNQSPVEFSITNSKGYFRVNPYYQ